MERVLIDGDPSSELVDALAARGLIVTATDPAPVALRSGHPTPMPSLPTLLLATLPDADAAAWIDAGHDVAPADTAPAVIAARLAALLRRSTAPPLAVGSLVIDPATRTARRAERPLPLLPREYALLTRLARSAGQTVGRAALLADVWGLGFDPGTNVVEVHVSRLRAKLDRGFAWPMLLTDKRLGYRLVPDGAIAAAAAAV